MDKIKDIIDNLRKISENPGVEIKKFKNETGKKAVGCFPVYVPEEIVYAADMLPVGIWGGQTDISEAKAYIPAFTCSIMQSCMELGLKGTYDELSAVIIPAMCDTLKCIGQDFKIAVPHIKTILFTHPQMRKIEAGVIYLETEYARIKAELESIAGIEITEEALNNAINVYNEHRAIMRRFVDVASKYTNIITPSVRHAVVKSGYFMDKKKHSQLVMELIEEIEKLPVEKTNHNRILVSGIVAEPYELLDILEENNIAIVCDDLAQETRQFRYDVPKDGGSPLYRLAQWWNIFEGCSLAYDPSKKRIDMILEDVKKYNVQGVIVCMMKFCDPEEYDYPLLKKALEDNDIPLLYMEIDQQTQINEQARTRIQGFREMLNMIY